MSLEPLPAKKDVDLTSQTTGNHVYACKVTVWPYSGHKKEETYPERTTFFVKAMNFKEATEKALLICEPLTLVYQVWVVNLEGVMRHD